MDLAMLTKQFRQMIFLARRYAATGEHDIEREGRVAQCRGDCFGSVRQYRPGDRLEAFGDQQGLQQHAVAVVNLTGRQRLAGRAQFIARGKNCDRRFSVYRQVVIA